MKQYLRPLGLVLTLLLLAAGAYAATSGDSLVSLSYLRDTFSAKGVQAGEEAGNRLLQKTYDEAKAKLDAAFRGSGGAASGSSSETLQRREWPDGQIITLSTGSVFVLLDGSANVVHTGAVVDVTTGVEAASGSSLIQNHRYIVGESTDAAVTIRSGQAAIGLQGGYTLSAGKTEHTPFYDVTQSDWFYAPVGRGCFPAWTPTTLPPTSR